MKMNLKAKWLIGNLNHHKLVNPYKQRKIDLSFPVEVYRCLNRKGKVFSVRQKGLVVGHTENLILKNCEFVINANGKKRSMATKRREVHAFVKGEIGTGNDVPLSFGLALRYNPFSEKGFVAEFTEGQFEIPRCRVVHFRKDGVFAYL